MVSYTNIQASNSLINDATASPRVAVFVGGTSGIGQLTVRASVATGVSMRIYLVGRKSSAQRMQTFIQELHALNSRAEVIWIEGEVTLLAETKRICESIREKEKEGRIDLLFLTPGYAPFRGIRRETVEGVEIVQSLEYYSRMLFVLHLLPLLDRAEAPRVVSVLAGGLEWASSLDVDDLDLKRPGNFGARKARAHYPAMNTMTLEKLAADYPHVTFIHSWPGLVNTGNVRRGLDPDNTSIFMVWFVWFILEPIISLFATSDEVAGQRHLFQCTSAAFGGSGIPWKGEPGINTLGKIESNGLFLVNYKCDCTPNQKAVALLREKAQGKIWDHTQDVFRPYL